MAGLRGIGRDEGERRFVREGSGQLEEWDDLDEKRQEIGGRLGGRERESKR